MEQYFNSHSKKIENNDNDDDDDDFESTNNGNNNSDDTSTSEYDIAIDKENSSGSGRKRKQQHRNSKHNSSRGSTPKIFSNSHSRSPRKSKVSKYKHTHSHSRSPRKHHRSNDNSSNNNIHNNHNSRRIHSPNRHRNRGERERERKRDRERETTRDKERERERGRKEEKSKNSKRGVRKKSGSTRRRPISSIGSSDSHDDLVYTTGTSSSDSDSVSTSLNNISSDIDLSDSATDGADGEPNGGKNKNGISGGTGKTVQLIRPKSGNKNKSKLIKNGNDIINTKMAASTSIGNVNHNVNGINPNIEIANSGTIINNISKKKHDYNSMPDKKISVSMSNSSSIVDVGANSGANSSANIASNKKAATSTVVALHDENSKMINNSVIKNDSASKAANSKSIHQFTGKRSSKTIPEIIDNTAFNRPSLLHKTTIRNTGHVVKLKKIHKK